MTGVLALLRILAGMPEAKRAVSHDLRAPLRDVMGFLDLLQRDAGQSLSEESLCHIQTISRSAKRMGELIEDLLAFSKLGHSTMQKTEVNLNELTPRYAERFSAGDE